MMKRASLVLAGLSLTAVAVACGGNDPAPPAGAGGEIMISRTGGAAVNRTDVPTGTSSNPDLAAAVALATAIAQTTQGGASGMAIPKPLAPNASEEPCSLLREEELSAVFGERVKAVAVYLYDGPDEPGGRSCMYSGTEGKRLALLELWLGRTRDLQAHQKNSNVTARSQYEQAWSKASQSGFSGPGTAQSVPGLGDAAFFHQNELHVLRGDAYVSLNVTLTDPFQRVSLADIKPLAEKALPRAK